MAGIKKRTERKYSVTLVANTVYELSLDRDTEPNLLQLWNRGSDSIYISDSRGLTLTRYDKVISASSNGIATYPSGVEKIYLLSVSACDVDIKTYETDEMYSSDLDKTQETVVRTITAIQLMNTATNCIVYNVECTDADTEYSQVLPANTKRFSITMQGGLASNNYRIAFEAGKVATPTAPFLQYKQDIEWGEMDLDLSGKTIYFASSSALKIAQITVWT